MRSKIASVAGIGLTLPSPPPAATDARGYARASHNLCPPVAEMADARTSVSLRASESFTTSFLAAISTV